MARRCAKCNKVGHYAPTCKKRGKKKISKKAHKANRKTKRRTTTTGGRGYSLIGRGSGWKVFHYGGRTDKGNVSNKTWAIKVSGTTVTTRHGKSWGQKKETPKRFGSRDQAMTFAARKINEKLRKGYYFVGGNRRLRNARHK